MLPKWIRLGIILSCAFNLLACTLDAIDGCWVDAMFEMEISLCFGVLFLYDKRVEVVIKHHRDERQNGSENARRDIRLYANRRF